MRNKLLLGTLLGICAFVFLGIAAPDTLDQKSARTYGSVGEAGDILLLVHYILKITKKIPNARISGFHI